MMMWWWCETMMTIRACVLERLSDLKGRSTKGVHFTKGRAHNAIHRRSYGRLDIAGFCPHCGEQCEP